MDGTALEVVVGVTGIFSFICYVFKYVVINPLETAINGLRVSIDELKAVTKEVQINEHEIEKTLVEQDNRIKSLQHRMDEFDKKSLRFEERFWGKPPVGGGDVYIRSDG